MMFSRCECRANQGDAVRVKGEEMVCLLLLLEEMVCTSESEVGYDALEMSVQGEPPKPLTLTPKPEGQNGGEPAGKR